MEQINQILKNLDLNSQLTTEDIPQVDLYIDQVIQLFENKYAHSKRNEEEKILTKTMINNYAKGKLFIPIKNKKYSKDHLMLINLIYQLKGALSINDIKKTLDGMNKKIEAKDFNLDRFYENYLSIAKDNVESFKEDIVKKATAVKEATTTLNDEHIEELQKIMLITSLTNMSNYYRRVAEKLVDELAKSENEEKRK